MNTKKNPRRYVKSLSYAIRKKENALKKESDCVEKSPKCKIVSYPKAIDIKKVFLPKKKTGSRKEWDEKNFKSKIHSKLRQIHLYHWKPWKIAKAKKTVFRLGLTYCSGCNKLHQKVEMDHIESLGPDFWDKVVKVLRPFFAEEKDYQPLCGRCHDKKHGKKRRSSIPGMGRRGF